MRILIFDDDAELCEELAELLRAEGYTVDTATDGFRAARLACEKYHDLVLLDFSIPGVNRVALLGMLRRRNPFLKTCVITGNPAAESWLEKEKISSFVHAVIRKPLQVDPLLQTISSLAA